MPPQPGRDGLHRPHRAPGVVVAVHVQAIVPALGGFEARVVDPVEEMLERPGHVPDVGRGAQQVAVRAEHVDGGRGQRGPGHDLDALDLVGARAGQHRLEHRLHGR